MNAQTTKRALIASSAVAVAALILAIVALASDCGEGRGRNGFGPGRGEFGSMMNTQKGNESCKMMGKFDRKNNNCILSGEIAPDALQSGNVQ